jgi:hypothetical protein
MTLVVQNSTQSPTADDTSSETQQTNNDVWVLKRDRGQHSLINKAVFDKMVDDRVAVPPGQSGFFNRATDIQDSSRIGNTSAGASIQCTKSLSDLWNKIILPLGTASPYKTSARPTHYPAQPPSVLRLSDIDESSNIHRRPKTELCRNFCQTGILCHIMAACPSCCLECPGKLQC